MKRIYFFDIDNTLLDHHSKTIPDSALTAIAGLQHAGHTVVIATGRSYAHARPYIAQIKPSYAITQNGARILKGTGEDEVLTVPLAREALRSMFGWMQQLGHPYGINSDSAAHLSALDPVAIKPLGTMGMTALADVERVLEDEVYQAWLFFDEPLDPTLTPEILRRFPDFDLVRWNRTALDVLPKGINKWTGCQWVLKQTGFAPAQAIAFGDGLNDLEMLQGVGLGIAMDNGHPTLKAIAKRIAPALHLDGIAAMLAELGHLPERSCPA